MIARLLSLSMPLLQVADEMDPEAGEFNVFLFCFLVVGLVTLCVLTVIGIIVGLVAAAAIAGVGMMGITANAIIVGLTCKSTRAGLTTLVLQFGAALGLMTGAATCLAIRWLQGSPPFELVSILVCGASGAVLGTGFTWISFKLITRIFEFLRERFLAGRQGTQSSVKAKPTVTSLPDPS